MKDLYPFQSLQRQFAAHLRNPEANPPPAGLEDRRLAIYRELFFNNVRNFLEQGFPVLHSVLPTQRWLRLVRSFFAEHRCESPYFVDIPEAFVQFLLDGPALEADDPGFLVELAHYEWMELVLEISQETLPEPHVAAQTDLLEGAPLLSPLYTMQCYQYPVHEIGADYQPATPLAEPQWLLIYRNRADKVGFMAINAATARLLQLLEQQPGRQGKAAIVQLAEEMQHPDPLTLMGFAADLLAQMHEREIIVGCAASND